MVTVPKTIASGENITIPSGRVAVLPNVQIDGTLNVQGDVFIPSGATLSSVVEKVTSTDNAIVRFDGTTGKVQNSGVIIDDNNNVGIGTSSPTSPLTVKTTSSYLTQDYLGDSTNGYVGIRFRNSGNTATTCFQNYDNGSYKIGTVGTDSVQLWTNNTERMRIDSAGNVGIGVNPSAWISNVKSIELNNAFISSGAGWSGAANAIFGNNFYLDSSSSAEKYKSNGLAHKYQQGVNGHQWFVVPSGTAGNAITWTNAMTLASSGNLLVGTSTDNGVDKLQVNGSISATSTVSCTQFKRNTSSPGGMTGYFGDKVEYALRNAIGTTSKTFRVTCGAPLNNESIGLFIKTKQVQYNVNPCVGIFDWMCGFKQPGNGATVTLVHTTTCASYGMVNQISINVAAVNSSSFDVTLSTTTSYLNAVIELEAIYSAGTCTITPQ